jgi:hypothetical protein
MSLEIDFILEQVREILGASCDPQLRLVSKRCNAVMQRYPRQDLQVCDFVSSGSLLLWAKKTLKMRWKGICDEIVKAVCLDALKWARAQKWLAAWSTNTASVAARGGHLEVLQWMRAQSPPCPWNSSTFARSCGGRTNGCSAVDGTAHCALFTVHHTLTHCTVHTTPTTRNRRSLPALATTEKVVKPPRRAVK